MILFYLSLLVTVSTKTLPAATAIVPVKATVVKEVIKVYPTPDNKGSLTVHSSKQPSLTFYLFDLEGKLIYQSIIRKNEKQQIEGLPKGTYLYNAFLNDENMEGGKVELK